MVLSRTRTTQKADEAYLIEMLSPGRVLLCFVVFFFFVAPSLHHNVFVESKKSNCRKPKGKSPKKGGSSAECVKPSGKVPPSSPPSPARPNIPEKPVLYTYDIVGTLDRDVDIFTQGLEIWKQCKTCRPSIFSSSGLVGQSYIIEQDLKSGETVQMKRLPDDEFGEGLTILDKKLYQTVWQTQKLYVYEANNFDNMETKEHPAPDGWGLANDGKHLIISDGSHKLTFVKPSDPKTVVKTLSVTFEGTDVVKLNEIEWIDGIIYANIWKSDCIAKIDPSNGRVFGWIEAEELKILVKETITSDGEDLSNEDYTLNGIAVRPGKTSPLYVTGKKWPKTFLIEEYPANGGRPMSAKEVQRIKETCLVE